MKIDILSKTLFEFIWSSPFLEPRFLTISNNLEGLLQYFVTFITTTCSYTRIKN